MTDGTVALVDEGDRALVSSYRWYAHTHGYPIAHDSEAPSVVYMHRLIMQPPDRVEVDHINGNPRDNRRQNLRVATRQQQMWNLKLRSDSTTGYKGVERRPSGRFHAYIRHEGRRHHLGTYDDAVTAAGVYDLYAFLYRGRWARLNLTEDP